MFAFRFHHCCFLLFPASVLVFTRYMKSRKLYFLRIYTSTYGTFGFAVRSRWDWLVLLVDEKGVKGYISEDAAHFQSCCYTWAQPTHEHSPGLNAYTAYTFYPIFWDKFLDFLARKQSSIEFDSNSGEFSQRIPGPCELARAPGSPPIGLSGCSDLLHSDCWQKSSAELIAEPRQNGNVSRVIIHWPSQDPKNGGTYHI